MNPEAQQGILQAPTGTTSFADYLTNARTGNLTANQISQINAQNPGAATDIQNAVNTFNAPGAFGITWTGAGPSGPDWVSTLTSSLSNPDPYLGIPIWVWLAGGGLALFLLVRK